MTPIMLSLYQSSINSINDSINTVGQVVFNKLGLPSSFNNIKECCDTSTHDDIKSIFKYIEPSLQNNHVDCFKNAFNDITVFEHKMVIMNRVARIGNVEILEYLDSLGLIRKYAKDNADEYSANFMSGIVKHLDCLTWLHENNHPWDESTCSKAAKKGNLKCLKYAHENGCPWNSITCDKAALGNNLECLVYAHENGCRWTENTCSAAAALIKRATRESERLSLGCLMYAYENGCPWDIDTSMAAAEYGNLECLKYAHEHGCPFDKDSLDIAEYTGNWDCADYISENLD